jgi:hypothetical protein
MLNLKLRRSTDMSTSSLRWLCMLCISFGLSSPLLITTAEGGVKRGTFHKNMGKVSGAIMPGVARGPRRGRDPFERLSLTGAKSRVFRKGVRGATITMNAHAVEMAKEAKDSLDEYFRAAALDKANGNLDEVKQSIRDIIDSSYADPNVQDELKKFVDARRFNVGKFITAVHRINDTPGAVAATNTIGGGLHAPKKTTFEGFSRDESTSVMRSFASSDGRSLQVLRQVSTLLFYRFKDTTPTEIQAMAVGQDIYISSNNHDTIDALNAELATKGLIGVLNEKTKFEKNTSTDPADIHDREMLQRMRSKLQALSAGKRSGDPVEYGRAGEIFEAIKHAGIGAAPVVDVRFAKGTRKPIVSPLAPGVPGTPRIILVKGSGGKQASHAEMNLTRVLTKIPAATAGTVHIAGTKRACEACGGSLVDTLAEGHDLRFSAHFGKLWKDQLPFYPSERQRLLAGYLAIAHPVFETYMSDLTTEVAIAKDDESDSEDETKDKWE